VRVRGARRAAAGDGLYATILPLLAYFLFGPSRLALLVGAILALGAVVGLGFLTPYAAPGA
jgi:hypothetical protein